MRPVLVADGGSGRLVGSPKSEERCRRVVSGLNSVFSEFGYDSTGTGRGVHDVMRERDLLKLFDLRQCVVALRFSAIIY